MNKHKHTPGPWAWNSKDMPFADIEDARGNVIAGMNECVRHDAQQARAEERANARLIASAPDMLAALKGIIDQACCNGCPEHENARTGNITVRHTPECEAAMAAIAKAEGGA